MTLALPHAISTGDLIDGRYRVISLLAEGGMGAVFLAEHMGLSKEVALKVIHKGIAGDGDMRARFAREAMASAQIDHPHVASTLDIGALPDGKRKDRLTGALDGVIELFADRVLPFDIDAARHYANLAVKARTAGKGFPTPDGYIAAIAAAKGFVVATRDTSAFDAANVEVIDPWKAER